MTNSKKRAKSIQKRQAAAWRSFEYTTFGEVLKEDWRGVLLPSRLVNTFGTWENQGPDISLQELYGFLFFWDRLAVARLDARGEPRWPTDIDHRDFGKTLNKLMPPSNVTGKTAIRHNVFGPEAPKNREGLERSRYAQYHVFHSLEREQPGRWAIAERKGIPIVGKPTPGRALLVRLHNAVPIPDRAMRLDKIIDFRERRRAEMLAFRFYAEELFRKIASSADPALSFRSEFDSLAHAIAVLVETLEEARVKFRFVGLQAKLKWEFDTTGILSLSAVGAALAGLEGAIAGGLLGAAHNLMPKVVIEASSGLADAAKDGPLHYAFLINEQF